MFFFLWVLLRLTLILGSIFALSLFLVMRAMARQIRENQGLGRNSKGGQNLRHHIFPIVIALVGALGIRRHQWGLALTGSGIALSILAIVWWDKVSKGAPSRWFCALLDRGPASEHLWFRAAQCVGVVFLLDTFVTGEWRYSPGLLVAFLWCLAWGFFTRHFQQSERVKTLA